MNNRPGKGGKPQPRRRPSTYETPRRVVSGKPVKPKGVRSGGGSGNAAGAFLWVAVGLLGVPVAALLSAIGYILHGHGVI